MSGAGRWDSAVLRGGVQSVRSQGGGRSSHPQGHLCEHVVATPIPNLIMVWHCPPEPSTRLHSPLPLLALVASPGPC